MASGHRQDALYGHGSEMEYDLETQHMSSSRIRAYNAVLEAVQGSQTLIRHADVGNDDSNSELPRIQPLGQLDKQIKAITAIHAHVQPCSSLLRPLLRESGIVQRASYSHDPLRGSLMSFGDIHSRVFHRRISVVVATSDVSESKFVVYRIAVRDQMQTDLKYSYTKLRTRHIEDVEGWNAGPIQQIKFRQSIYGDSNLLAIRQSRTTKIFRPFQGDHHEIRPNLLYTIHVEQKSGMSHADVAFNPWFFQQVALVDQAGYWTVVQFDSQKLRKVAQVWKGSADPNHPQQSSPLYDGWGRIAWVFSNTTIAVCTRQSVSLFDISNAEPTKVQSLNFRPVDCLIDMILLPGRVDWLSILTSTHVQLYRTTRNSSGEISMNLILNIRHLLISADLSTSLSSYCEGDYTTFLLFSRTYRQLRRYTCKISDTNFTQCSEPTLIKLPQSIVSSETPSHIADMAFTPVQARDSMYRLDILLTTGTLYNCLYRHTKPGGDDDPIDYTSQKQQVVHISHRARRSKFPFVISDDEFESQSNRVGREEPLSRRNRQRRVSTKAIDRPLDFEFLVHRLQPNTASAEHISAALSHVQRTLKEPVAFEIPALTLLYDYTQSEFTFRDAEEADSHVQNIRLLSSDLKQWDDPSDDQPDQRYRLIVDQIPLSSIWEKDVVEDSTIPSKIYKRIIKTWIKPLPDTISLRTRLAKEQLARRITTDVVLSQLVTRVSQIPEPQASQQTQDEKPSLSWELPVRAGPSTLDKHSLAQNGFLPPTSILPTPSPTATPSITTTASEVPKECPEINRLSHYTTFSQPSPLPLPRKLNKILSHWTVGEDPASYDWVSTSRFVNQRDAEEDESLTEQEQRRARRRAARHILLQRREAAASEAQQLASSQAATVISASQPVGGKIESVPLSSFPASSQTVDLRAINASQVMPGRFGGRPPVRKKHRAGF